jgi:hypothetical protein
LFDEDDGDEDGFISNAFERYGLRYVPE